ncbi:NIPSNAP family protein [Streptacidiphilus sp. N1-12]|uniref:NIPSNAP family protein n=2 Tax=Streptacidiphilus alkalitolerans TaxID=3342712 RepID=A0ABV6W9K7_9ACTN
MLYELAALSLEPFTVPKALAELEHYTTGPQAAGELLGCWEPEHGEIFGRVILLRCFSDALEHHQERRRVLTGSNPYGVGEYLQGFEATSHTQFPYLPPITPGSHGGVYEIRTYHLTVGGLGATMAGWQSSLPARTALSPLTTALYALDGHPRITHIWPYSSLDQRLAVRAQAKQLGIWPPAHGPQYVTRATSTIALPTSFSPLS